MNQAPPPLTHPETHHSGQASVWIGIVIAAVIILLGGLYVFGRNQPAPSTNSNLSAYNMNDMTTDGMYNNSAPTIPVTSSEPAAVSSDTSVKTFTVTGQNFQFSPAEIRVNQGDTVRIIFSSTSGFHDWVIDEFNAATNQVMPGTITETQFVADKTGTFEYYCSVGNHRQMGMVGQLIVE